jgi:amino acid adenylation domain-containing protein
MKQPPRTLIELIDRTAALYPDAPAAADDEGELTYQQLVAEAGLLAARLAARGIGRGDRVAVALPRGIPVLVCMLAVLRTGAAYVPVDGGYPAARREHMLTAGRARLVLVAPGRAGQDGAGAEDVMEYGAAAPAARLAPELLSPAGPLDAACVLFTSGTTGRPRGVVLEHRQMTAFALDPAVPRLGPGDRTAQTSSISFDTFTFEAWRSFAGGAQVVVLPGIPDLMSADIGRELRRRRITVMLAPAIALNHIARNDREALATLRVVCSGGDVLQPATCRELIAGGFAGHLLNLYGPTETTVALTGFPVPAATGGLPDQVPIGFPFSWARIYILDDRLAPVPDGIPGELYAGGAGVGRGYLGLPGETAGRFVADPAAADGSRMYSTGDLVRRGPGGAIEYLGRRDSQVKIRGHRVEPREVERILLRSGLVAEAAVLAVGEQDQRRLVAVVVPAGEDLVLRELRTALAPEAPSYQIPAEFVVVGAMPSDAHGKRDWSALRQLLSDRDARRRTYVAPLTETERYLARAWEDLLAVESIGLGDDFFELGGHSLLAAHLRLLLRRSLRTTVEPELLFEHSVLADQATMIDRLRHGSLTR